LRHDGTASIPGGITLEHLADAGEAMLLEMVKTARRTGPVVPGFNA
jgi:pyroglutamyl-peptidase